MGFVFSSYSWSSWIVIRRIREFLHQFELFPGYWIQKRYFVHSQGMCSVADLEQVGEEKTSKLCSKLEASPKLQGNCMKCSETAVVLVRNGDPLCRACFLDYAVHKFRATIGKARVIHQGEKVLLAVSGGASSCAMLDLVIRGLRKETPKKHRFQPGVVHIDEGELLGRTAEERESVKERIKNTADTAGFSFHVVILEDLFLGNDSLKSLGISDITSSANSHLVELFSNINSITAKEDLLSHLYRWQLQKTAREHGYDRIMVGDCSTSLSIRILSDIAQGRGSQLPFNIGFQDSRAEVSILRPMREFTKKVIEFYNLFNKVPSFSLPSFSTMGFPHASVNRLTQEFLLGLQAAFPSTVSTVLRTGEKLSSHFSGSHPECCSICLIPLETELNLSPELSKPKSHGGGCKINMQSGDGDDCSSVGGDNGRCAKEGGNDCSGISDNNDRCGKEGGGDDCCSVGGTGNTRCASGGMHSNSEIENSITGDMGDNLVAAADDNECNEIDLSSFHLLNTLCYGCRLTYNDIKSERCLLPAFVTDNVLKISQRTAMKEQIKDYLLND